MRSTTHRSLAGVGLLAAGLCALALSATGASGTTVRAARTISLNESGSLHLTSHHGFHLNLQGTASGTIRGTIYIHLNVTSPTKVTAEVSIYPNNGSLTGGDGQLPPHGGQGDVLRDAVDLPRVRRLRPRPRLGALLHRHDPALQRRHDRAPQRPLLHLARAADSARTHTHATGRVTTLSPMAALAACYRSRAWRAPAQRRVRAGDAHAGFSPTGSAASTTISFGFHSADRGR